MPPYPYCERGEYNLCGHGEMKGKLSDNRATPATSATYTECPHHTGWFFIVRFWIFKKRLYWCDLCHKVFDAKVIRKLLKKAKK